MVASVRSIYNVFMVACTINVTRYPTSPFTILELWNTSHDVPELLKIRRSADIKALKLEKGSSGNRFSFVEVIRVTGINVRTYIYYVTMQIVIGSKQTHCRSRMEETTYLRYVEKQPDECTLDLEGICWINFEGPGRYFHKFWASKSVACVVFGL